MNTHAIESRTLYQFDIGRQRFFARSGKVAALEVALIENHTHVQTRQVVELNFVAAYAIIDESDVTARPVDFFAVLF